MAILVIAEHDHSVLKSATLNAVTAASALGDVVVLVTGGAGVSAVASAAASVSGVAKVLVAESAALANGLAEQLAPVVVSLASGYSHIVAGSTSFGRNLLPRVAALLDVAPLTDVIKIESADTFVRPIYAGNVFATVKSADTIRVLTVRTTAFEAAASSGGHAAIESLSVADTPALSTFIRQTLTQSDRPELPTAKVVVSGGRALGSQENFQSVLNPLADTLNAAVGASRAAVDAGYAPNDTQVGQTGVVVAPDLYIAVGISGAIQHLAGMKDSRVIVAINQDEDAPIFQVADYGIVGDLFTVVPELVQALKA